MHNSRVSLFVILPGPCLLPVELFLLLGTSLGATKSVEIKGLKFSFYLKLNKQGILTTPILFGF